jgi:hypothetical protein
MTADPCEHFRGLIAMDVVGQLTADERVALTAHAEGCPACRDEWRELSTLPPILAAGDPDRFEALDLPVGLRTAVLERLDAEGRRQRGRRRARYLVGSAAAAVVMAVAVVAALVWPSGPVTRTMVLGGTTGVHADVRLVSEPWGTAMELRESGQPPGEVLSVAMRTVSGRWWQTGTYRTAGSSVRVTMACAVKLPEISGVWVRDSTGKVVLHGSLPGYDGGGS